MGRLSATSTTLMGKRMWTYDAIATFCSTEAILLTNKRHYPSYNQRASRILGVLWGVIFFMAPRKSHLT